MIFLTFFEMLHTFSGTLLLYPFVVSICRLNVNAGFEYVAQLKSQHI